MTPDQPVPWQTVKPILVQVMAAPRAQWAERTAELCGENQALAAAVWSYLDVKEAAADFLEGSPPLAPVQSSMHASWEGRIMGAYRLIRPIGQGGMGTVFLAERADAVYNQKVALKVLSSGLDSARMAEDFERERQMLAHLEHPHIARILDGGTTAEGRPYYVMEFIDGKPLDRYCQDHRLTVRQRLDLFTKICEAVDYAHQNLIIHRDLKPGNILITSDGIPKLLDFGTAKMLVSATNITAKTQTVTRFRAMTPAYASPEQVSGKPMTTASDVYALGVILFELLTGCLPYEFPTQAAHDVHRTICETPPLSLSRYWQGFERHADHPLGPGYWQSTTSKMKRQLRGDLSVIVEKALNKEPGQRYATVAQLHLDIQRFQKQLPIHAIKAGPLKKTLKFIRRHRLATGAALLAAIALTSTLFAAFWQARIAQRERLKAEQHLQQAMHERTQALRQSRKSESVTQLLVDLFKVADPYRRDNQDLSARDFLDRSAKQRFAQLADEPELRASMLETVGKVYLNLGLAHQAEPVLLEALSLREALLQERHPDLARNHHLLGKVEIHKNRFGLAETHLRKALSLSESQQQTQQADLADIYHDLAITLQTKGQPELAEPYYRQTLALNIARFGEHHPEVARTQVELSELDVEKGQWDQVEANLFQALAVQQEALGQQDIAVITTQQVLAEFWARSGEAALSHTMFSHAYANSLRLLGPDHPRSLLLASQHAKQFRSQGLYAEAVAFLHWILSSQQRVLDAGNLSIAGTHQQLAMNYAAMGNWPASHCHFQETLEIYRHSFGEAHPYVAACLEVMGDYLSLYLEPTEVRALQTQALAIRRATLGADHPQLARNYSGLGWLAYRQENYREAIAWYEKMYQAQQKGDSEPSTLVFTENILAILYRDQGWHERAEQAFAKVLTKRRALLPQGDPQLAQTLVPFGELLIDLKQWSRAQAYLQEGLTLRLADQTTPEWLVGNARFFLGICLWLQEPKDPHLARIWRGYDEMTASLVENHPLLRRAQTRLAMLGLDPPHNAPDLVTPTASN